MRVFRRGRDCTEGDEDASDNEEDVATVFHVFQCFHAEQRL